MNCPNCGAENEVDARFCAECGTPLESVDQLSADDDDRTIMSTVSEISEEAKTVAVTQEDVANLAAEMKNNTEAGFQTDSPPAGPPTNAGNGGSNNTQRNIIIGVVVLLFLCCCCCVLLSLISSIFGDSIDIDSFSFLRDFSPAMMALI